MSNEPQLEKVHVSLPLTPNLTHSLRSICNSLDNHFDWIPSVRQPLLIGDGIVHLPLLVRDHCIKIFPRSLDNVHVHINLGAILVDV